MSGRRGFTLSEIVVVVAVISIAGALGMAAMSGQVSEAKAKADAKALVMRLQAEHRTTRERLQPLKIMPQTGRVIFQPTRGAGCVTADGPPREAVVERASLFIAGGSLCLTGHGEVEGAAGVPGMAVHASLNVGQHQVVPLRLDRTGIHGAEARIVGDSELQDLFHKFETDPEDLIGNLKVGGGEVTTPIGTQ